MTTLRKTLFFALLACALFASLAQAAPTITVYLGEDRVSNMMVRPNSQFTGWVVLSGLNDNVNALEYTLDLPPWVVVLDRGFIDHTVRLSSGISGVALGFGECHIVYDDVAGAEELVIQHFTAYSSSLFSPYDVTLTAFQGNPQDPATAPRYSDCDGNVTELAVVGATLSSVVSNDDTSFGAVKALYQ